MPSIADQVATIEHDLAAALAQIDALTASNAALSSANASLQRDNIALQLEVNDMKHYVDDTRAMVEKLSQSALDLLRASRRQAGQPTKPRADEAERLADLAGVTTDGAVLPPDFSGGIDRATNPLWKNRNSLDAKIATLPDKWPAQQAVAEIMAGDSGDEQPAAKMHVMEGRDVGTPVPPNRFEPLPIFLQRDTAFDASANVRPIFG